VLRLQHVLHCPFWFSFFCIGKFSFREKLNFNYIFCSAIYLLRKDVDCSISYLNNDNWLIKLNSMSHLWKESCYFIFSP
jgi:hypothetical protein